MWIVFRRIYPILAVIIVDCIGAGIVLPVGPRILSGISGESLGQITTVYSWLVASYSLAVFLFAPLMGRLSDRFGRIPVLVAALGGLAIDYMVFSISRSIWLLFVSRVLAGACGASVGVAAAYVSDSTSPETRAAGFGLMGAASGIGSILGPLLGGVLGITDPRMPFVVAAILAGVNCLVVLVILPESLPVESRRRFAFRDINPTASFLKFRTFPILRQLAASLFFFEISNLILPTIWVIFTSEHLDWSPPEIGLSFTLMGVMQIVIQGGLTHAFVRILSEYGVLLLGGILIMVGFFLAGSSHTTVQAFIAVFVLTFGWMAGPATNSLLSNQVAASEQGELQGAMRSLESVGTMLGPLLAGWAYDRFSRGPGAILPGAPLLLGGGLVLVALLCAAPVISRGLSERKVLSVNSE